jgi:hypothetical protein
VLVPMRLRIDFAPSKIPGQLLARVVYLNAEGHQLTDGGAGQLVGPGHSIGIGPVHVGVGNDIQVGPTPDLVRLPFTPAGPGPATGS